MKSLGFKLTLAVICGLLVSIAITVGISVVMSSNLVKEEILDKCALEAKSEANNLNSWVSAQKANLATLSDVLSAFEAIDEPVIRPIFRNVIDHNDSYSDVYMGFPDNTAVMGSGYPIEEYYDVWKATERSWYRLAMSNTNLSHVTQPYVDQMTGLLCITISRAIVHNGQVMGVIGADILLPDFEDMVMNITLGGTSYAMILDSNGDVIVHPGDYAPAADGSFYNIRTMGRGIYADVWSHVSRSNEPILAKDEHGVKRYYSASEITATGWLLLIVLPESAITEPIVNLVMIILLVTVFIIAAVAFFIYMIIARFVSKPLHMLASVAENVADGDLNVNIDSSSEDETGQLAGSMKKMAQTIRELIMDMNNMSKSHTQGDIDAKVSESKFNGSYQEVAAGVNALVGTYIQHMLDVCTVMGEFSSGNFDVEYKELPGKKNLSNQVVESMRANLKSIDKEISSLVEAANRGNLDKRAESGKYKGSWAELLERLNNLVVTITLPINETVEVMKKVSEGDFGSIVKGNYSGEFLVLKNAINGTITNFASYIDEMSNVLNALANDDLDQDIRREYVGKFSDIKNALLNIIIKFNTVISSIASASEQVASGAKMISESSMSLATGATEQASSVQELNATIQTINENTLQNAENAKEANKLSGGLTVFAVKGNEDMNHMLDSMNSIKDSSNRISRIIKVIEDIAFQTNLLALNAAVEAARAGVHGKGFTVVADEVRSLAGKTQVSAKETAELIEEAISRVNDGTSIANQTDEALKSIVSETSKVADIINKISKASDEQALAFGQVMLGINQITDVVQRNSASAEESASASQELASQSDVLKGMTGVFNLRNS